MDIRIRLASGALCDDIEGLRARFAGWSAVEGESVEGYHIDDYFSRDGHYLGPDERGIEPMFWLGEES